eukprot:RCo010858
MNNNQYRAEGTLAEKVAEAKQIILQALEQFGSEKLSVSFNGGKDSVVMFDLVREVFREKGAVSPKLVFQFAEQDPFPEMKQFVRQFTADNGITQEIIPCASFKEGLQKVADRGVQAVLMGTRRTDPDGKYLSSFTPCSPGWPPLIRVCPLLSWNYQQIWEYTLAHSLPYCSLYDQGYTSIGTTRNTVPNPLLRIPGTDRHLPASELHDLPDGRFERMGRTPSASAKPASRATTPSSARVHPKTAPEATTPVWEVGHRENLVIA